MSGFAYLVSIISATLISRSRVDFCRVSHLQQDILVEYVLKRIVTTLEYVRHDR